MPGFDDLSPQQLAEVYLATLGDEDRHFEVFEYTVEMELPRQRDRWIDLLVELVDAARTEDEIGYVAAGPVEACLDTNLEWALEVERRSDIRKLARVVEQMHPNPGYPKVVAWRRRIIEEAAALGDGLDG